MATTFVDYTGDGNATKQFSFASIKEADIKVEVDNVVKTAGNHYNITSYSTTGGGNVVFTSGNIPASPAAIRIYRDTDVDAAKATFVAGSSVKAGDLNNNMTQVLYAAQEEQNQTILTSDIKDAAVTTAKIKADNITAALIADDQINSEHYVAGSIDHEHLANDIIDGDNIQNDVINSEHYVAGSIDHEHLANDIIDGDNIQDNAINSEHYTDGSIDREHLAADIVDGTKLADNAVNSEHITAGSVDLSHMSANSVDSDQYVDGSVDRIHLEADIIDSTKLADNAVNSEHYVDGSIDRVHLAADIVDGTKIADDSINSEHYVDGSIDAAHLSENSVETAKIVDSNVTTVKIADSNVTTAKIAADAITGAKIADDAVDSEHYTDGSIDTAHIGSAQVTDAKLASNSVITSKITDANVTTVKIADSNITLAKLASDLKQTSISDSDTQIPTSGAVVDYVAAQIAPLGGLEVIATDAAFPNTQPASGVVISISDAGGVVFNGSGVSTTGRTVGGSTVTINGAPSSLYSETLAAGVGLMVSSTGSSQTYNYHKILGKESDIKQLSDDINDFAERYRVGSSNPTSSLHAGDLFFNTGSSKLLVYNATNSAWEETQTVGNFFINTISSSSGTGGGSATFNGSAYRFTISNAGTYAQQHIVSINGVVQKPNTGTSQPSEGFAIDGGDIIFSSAPASGADYFIITVGASVSIGTPSDGTVSTAKLANGAVTTAKLADANVTTAKIADDAVTAAKLASDAVVTASIVNANVTTAKIADDAVTAAKIADNAINNASMISGAIIGTGQIVNDAVTGAKIADDTIGTAHISDSQISEAKLQISNSPTNGYFLSAQSGNTGGLTWAQVSTDLVADTSPQLGGDLDTNSHEILLDDNHAIKFGAASGGDLKILHDGTNSEISNYTGTFYLFADSVFIGSRAAGEPYFKGFADGATELYYNSSKKFNTRNAGIDITGDLRFDTSVTGGIVRLADDQKIFCGSGDDLQIYHDGSDSFIDDSGTGNLFIRSSQLQINKYTGENMIKAVADGAVELYNDNSKKFETGVSGEYGSFTATNGSNSWDGMAVGGGAIVFMGTSSAAGIWNDTDNEWMLKCTRNGTTELQNNGNKKLETTGEGIALFDSDGDTRITFYTNTSSNRGSVYASSGVDIGFLNSSGSWSFRVDNNKSAHFYNHTYPASNNSYDLGSSSYKWRNIYTNDLHLSNEGHSNDIDGTWGNWTIQEGESDLFLKNNRSGKKYKFNLTEVS